MPLAISGAARIKQYGFEKILTELISSGGDTDTIASIAGQIAGTLIGYKDLPLALISRLPERELISDIAAEFAEITIKAFG